MDRGSDSAPHVAPRSLPQRARQAAAGLRLDGSLAFVALAMLGICLLYTFAYPLLGHYPGLSLTYDWVVLDTDDCDPARDWCRQNQLQVLPGDRLLRIGDLTYAAYTNDRALVPFGAYHAGDPVPVILERDGQTVQINWQMPGTSGQVWNIVLFNLLFVLPFWLAGTVVMLFLRPRDARWGLLVIFNYLIATWLAAGFTSNTHLAGSAYVVRMAGWLMIPVFVHLHLHVPNPLPRLRTQISLTPFYLIPVILAVCELWAWPPPRAYIVGDALAVLTSLALIIYRLLNPMSPSDRVAARIMLTGVALAFGPGLILWVIPVLIDVNPPAVNVVAFATLVLPVLPLFYTYAAYKHRLGTLEFRANRLLSTYSFISLYGTAFLFIFSLLGRWLRLSTNALLAYLVFSAIFVIAALPLRQRFVRLVDRLAYGTAHDPDDLIRAFANRIPQALTPEDLVQLLVREVMPSLLIRQSALVAIPRDGPPAQSNVNVELVYAENVAVPGQWSLSTLDDVLADAGRYRFREATESVQVLGWVRLAVTLAIGERRRGIWLLGERHPDDFYPQKDIDLLTTLGNQVGMALHTASLLSESRRFAQDLKALHSVSSVVASSLQPQEVYKRTVETLAQVFGYSFVSIYRVEGERLHLQYQVGYDPQHLIQELPLTTGVMARAVRSGQPQFVQDVSLDHDFQRESPTLVSEIAVPVRSADQVLGVINVESAAPGQLTTNDLDLLLILANQLAIAITNAGLFDTVTRQLQQLELLREISLHMASSLDLKQVLDTIAAAAMALMRPGNIHIFLYDQTQDRFTFGHALWQDGRRTPVTTTLRPHGLSYQVVRSAAPVVVDHADHHPLYADWADRATVPQSIAGVPLMRAGRALGVFTTAFFDRQTIASQDQQLLTMLADQAAVAVDNAQLHATALRRVREFESLRQVELALASNLNLHQLLQTIVAQVIALVDAQGAGLYIYLPELDQLELRVSQQPASWPGDFSGTRLQRHEGLAGAVLASNQIIMTNDYHANFSSTPFADVPVSSVLGVPLTWGSEFLGVLTIFNTDTGRAFNLDDQRVVSLLSGQVAVAIVNARLYEDARLRAEKLAVAYAELKQLDRLKDEFVQTVSHELRTPLTFVCGYVDLLLEDVMGTLNPQQREALSIVSDRAAATVRLVNDIISMQQAEMEPRQPQPVDLADLVQTCGESARMTALSHGIEMGVMVAPNLPPVLGDADRLGEVLDNLLANAIKFSPNGGIIRVTAAPALARLGDDDAQAGIKVTIQDQGIGIAADQQTRIWERFYQVDSTKTRRFGGTGLGLAIAKRIVVAHGGVVGVESQLGAGSSFWFIVPAYQPAG
ncbi:MAG: GAF domain-containing protein [Anaerolineae bacterium]